MAEVIAAMKRAYAAYSEGRAEVPQRTHLPVPPHDALLLSMPAFVHDAGGDALAVKVVTIFPRNPVHGLPLIHAAVLALEADSGQPIALLEGSALTAIRTGAASGAATELLAHPESSVAAIFGAGVQGRTQLEAICTARPIQSAWIYDSTPQRARALIEEMAGKGPIPNDLRLAKDARQAVAQADIICTATTSLTPVFADRDLQAGVHINAVGAYTPEMCEVPPETVRRARVVVDSRQACLAEAGDLIQPLRAGVIDAEHITAELGEIALGKAAGRSGPEQVTFFKSVGIAVQDAAAARLALANALKMGLGQRVEW